jgi:hypothetical protein
MHVRIFQSVQNMRIVTLSVAVVSLAVFMVGCSLTGNAPVATTSDTGLTLGGGNSTVTPPPFPPFTVGAWVYDASPQKGDKDHVYVLTRVQDPTMQKPSSPPSPGVGVSVVIDGVGQNKTTDSDGYAVFDFDANATPTKPSIITVTTSYHGQQYQTTTFYTVLPLVASPTPVASVTPTTTTTPGP